MSAETVSRSNSPRVAWNKGRLVGQKRPLRPKEVWAIRIRLQMKRSKRDLALFNLAIDSKLRGCDLVALRVDDITAAVHVKDRATIIQHKTGRPVQFEIMEQTRASLQEWLSSRPNDRGPYVFPSRGPRGAAPLRSTVRPYRPWVDRKRRNGSHRLRDPFDAPHQGGQIYRKTGNLRAVQLLLGHSKIESTVRYLGVEVDDALTLSEQVEL